MEADLLDCRPSHSQYSFSSHAAWFPPRDLSSGKGAFYLLSGQPKTRLHSQLDNGAYSLSHKIKGREPVLIHPEDATALARDAFLVHLGSYQDDVGYQKNFDMT